MRAVPAPKMDEPLLNALSRLKKEAGFQKLLSYFEKCREARFRAAANLPDDAQSRWQQGRGQELDELLYDIEQCDETLNGMKGPIEKIIDKVSAF